MNLWWLALPLFGLAGLAVVLRRRCVLVTVSGLSMAPTIASGERVLVWRRPIHRLRLGAVVVLRPPHGSPIPAPLVVKRLAARPGDPVPPECADWPGLRARCPEDGVLVLGDNRGSSEDSRSLGVFPADGVVGAVCWHFRDRR